MPQYYSPGVYVEEGRPGSQPIAGVGTSTAGFIGVVAENIPTMPQLPDRTGNYQLAPVNEPRLITSWEGFKTAFGDFHADNRTLAHAVYGFFNNGGSRCHVIRVDKGADDNATEGALIAALRHFEPIDEIALVAIPGAVSDAVQNAILDHCAKKSLQDRFAILDGRRTTDLSKQAIQGGTNESAFGAIYFPWIRVFDPASNGSIVVPPSGHIAGIYARVDAERGVHKAPANEVIRGALDVEILLSREDQNGLNPEDINVIRRFGGNVTVWGAHTLAGKEDPRWRYINIRRLLLFLSESIEESTRWVVFEPNEPRLWATITRTISAFLTSVWRDGALFGHTPEEAFYVRCDATTNPEEVRDAGQVVAEIGVAVVKPAEFVILRIGQWAGPSAA